MPLALLLVLAAGVDLEPPLAPLLPDDDSPAATTEAKPSTSFPVASQPPLQAAEAALRAGIHKRCIELAQQALQTGQLDSDGVARAWWTRGRCHSIDGDADRAQRSYAVAVRVKPTILMPVDDAAFTRVKAEGTDPATALALQARAVVVPLQGGAIVAVEISANDDLRIGKACSLIDKDQVEVARAPLEHSTDSPSIQHRFSGIPVEGLRALLLDKHGNRLREVDVIVDDAARNALIAAGATPQEPLVALPVTWLSYVGAGTALVGIVGAATSGIALAVSTQAEASHVIDSELPYLLGFVGAVSAVVVGGTLVVVDQVPARGARP